MGSLLGSGEQHLAAALSVNRDTHRLLTAPSPTFTCDPLGRRKSSESSTATAVHPHAPEERPLAVGLAPMASPPTTFRWDRRGRGVAARAVGG